MTTSGVRGDSRAGKGPIPSRGWQRDEQHYKEVMRQIYVKGERGDSKRSEGWQQGGETQKIKGQRKRQAQNYALVSREWEKGTYMHRARQWTLRTQTSRPNPPLLSNPMGWRSESVRCCKPRRWRMSAAVKCQHSWTRTRPPWWECGTERRKGRKMEHLRWA